MKPFPIFLACTVAIAAQGQDTFEQETLYRQGIERVAQAALDGGFTAERANAALGLFIKAADAGHLKSQTWAAAMYLQLGTPEKALPLLLGVTEKEAGAPMGSVLPNTLLGIVYYRGEGVEKNYQKAAAYFERAANAGGACAASWLGSMYAKGNGVEKNEAQALRWHSRGSEAASFEFLGDNALKSGNAREACKWYRKGAFLGGVSSMLKYVKLSRIGETRDDDEAYHYVQVAVALGSDEAQRIFEEMKQAGVTESPKSVHRFLKTDAKQAAETLKRQDNTAKFLLRNSEFRVEDDRG